MIFFLKIDEDSPGMKFDDEKLRWDLLPYDAIEKIVEIMTHGANKYAPNNWRKVAIERYQGALMRHFTADINGEVIDKDSGLLHVAHMACNALFILWLRMKEQEVVYHKEKTD